jgi:dinuclear metal center YbgI/SA1388 family protein
MSVATANTDSAAQLSVYELEQLLLKAYPAADACEHDHIGLLVGNAKAQVTRIALALDAKPADIEAAAAQGCNVLVSHHPALWNLSSVFLKDRDSCCAKGPAQLEGTTIYRAIENNVALISMHTNLDCAPSAAAMLLDPVGYEYISSLAPSHGPAGLANTPIKETAPKTTTRLVPPQQALAGLGQLAVPRTHNNLKPQAVRLDELAQRCKKAFGAVAKVWGDPSLSIRLLASCSGDGGELVSRVIASGADCYLTGEVRYHEALELAAAGVALIELGHDCSELPYRFHLYNMLVAAGIAEEHIHIIEPSVFWWQP